MTRPWIRKCYRTARNKFNKTWRQNPPKKMDSFEWTPCLLLMFTRRMGACLVYCTLRALSLPNFNPADSTCLLTAVDVNCAPPSSPQREPSTVANVDNAWLFPWPRARPSPSALLHAVQAQACLRARPSKKKKSQRTCHFTASRRSSTSYGTISVGSVVSMRQPTDVEKEGEQKVDFSLLLLQLIILRLADYQPAVYQPWGWGQTNWGWALTRSMVHVIVNVRRRGIV